MESQIHSLPVGWRNLPTLRVGWNDRAPARQTTGTFLFSGRNNDRAPARQTTGTFFSGCNNDRAPARQTTVSFFSGQNNDRDRKKKVPVVIKFVLVQLDLKLIQIR